MHRSQSIRKFITIVESDRAETQWPIVAKECSQIIAIYRQLNPEIWSSPDATRRFMKVLYRGVSNHLGNLIYKATPPQNRRPSATSVATQDQIDEWFYQHGFAARRGNSTFVAGNRGQAKDYSNHIYVVLPCDGTPFTWSPKVVDMFNSIPRPDSASDVTYEDSIQNFLDNADYQQDGIAEAISFGGEVMIAGPYWAIAEYTFHDIIAALAGSK